MISTAENLALIPILPLVGSLTVYVLCNRTKAAHQFAGWLATIFAALSFVISVKMFFELGQEHHSLSTVLWSWIGVGTFNVNFALRMDRLAATMSLIVTGVGSLIHLYAIGYMAEDDYRPRFFCYLNLFLFSMLLLVLGDNLLVMFVGWEGVGLCSYLLIGFWFKEMPNAQAGQKAFVVNRIGDAGFLLGMFILIQGTGVIDFLGLERQIGELSPHAVELAALLLFVGAVGKSAQFPLYVWLPDAMAGPTPVSALIHAATMVTAGVYMIARMSFLYLLAPNVLLFIAVIGTLTAFLAATIALVQNDIKRVLAYSTVSQLGFMFMAMGAGAFSNGIYHVVTHAFFKACLFMAAGSVIIGCHHEQDMRHFGGLRKYMPLTFLTYSIATLAIAGFPFLSGFYSKDAILWTVFSMKGVASEWYLLGDISINQVLWFVGVLTALMTAFYMTRSLMLTFFGEFRGESHGHHKPHESPWVVTMPLVILAALSAIFGFFWGEDFIHYLTHWTRADMAQGHQALAANESYHLLENISIGVALLGIGLAVLFYGPLAKVPDLLAKQCSMLYQALVNKWGVDQIYDALIVRPLGWTSSFLFSVIDQGTIDTVVNGAGMMAQANGELVRRVQTGRIGNYAVFMFSGMAVLVYLYLIAS